MATTTTTTPTAGTATDQQVADFVNTNFPSYSWVMQVPDLMNLFRKAITPGVGTDNGTLNESSAELVSQLENTDWWKSHGIAVRQYLNDANTDPDSQAEKIQAQDATVHDLANSMGLSDSQVNIDQMARNSLMYGWSDDELKEQLAGQANYSPTNPTTSNIGDIDNSIATLKQDAANYGVSFDDQTYFSWARDIAAGHHAVQDYTPLMIDQAKGKFPSLASMIDSGVTPSQYFGSTASEVSKLLEKTVTTNDLMNDPMYSKVISYTDPKTGAPRPMNLAETQSYIRSTDAWKGTNQGQAQASDFTEGLLQMFGKRGGSAPSGLGTADTF